MNTEKSQDSVFSHRPEKNTRVADIRKRPTKDDNYTKLPNRCTRESKDHCLHHFVADYPGTKCMEVVGLRTSSVLQLALTLGAIEYSETLEQNP